MARRTIKRMIKRVIRMVRRTIRRMEELDIDALDPILEKLCWIALGFLICEVFFIMTGAVR